MRESGCWHAGIIFGNIGVLQFLEFHYHAQIIMVSLLLVFLMHINFIVLELCPGPAKTFWPSQLSTQQYSLKPDVNCLCCTFKFLIFSLCSGLCWWGGLFLIFYAQRGSKTFWKSLKLCWGVKKWHGSWHPDHNIYPWQTLPWNRKMCIHPAKETSLIVWSRDRDLVCVYINPFISFEMVLTVIEKRY